MVGNDIVDLSLADKDVWKRPRYINKVCALSEQRLLAEAEDAGILYWVLWSMKESTYKLHFRKHLNRALNPIRFTCCFDCDSEPGPQDRFRGRVEVDDEVYQTHSIVNQYFVHTVAYYAETAVNIKEVSADPWKEVRKETIRSLIQSFSSILDLNPKEVKFQKDINGLPFLTEEFSGISKACSISHHGRYGAHAFTV